MMMKFRSLKVVCLAGATLATMVAFQGCGSSSSNPATEDTSTSGSVAGVISGSESGSKSGGTEARNEAIMNRLFAEMSPRDAEASTACGTFTAAQFTSCLAGSAPTPITYSSCSFGNSSAVWNGGVTLTCPGSNTVERAFTNGTTRVNAAGRTVTISTTGISDYANVSVAGGGTTWTAGNLTINGVELVGSRDSVKTFDHTITSSALTRSASGGTVTYNGTVTVYHNLVKVTATSTLNALTLTPGTCCMPTGGSITTVFSAGGIRSGFGGATESLTFTGCGTATYTGPEGYTGNVTVQNCI